MRWRKLTRSTPARRGGDARTPAPADAGRGTCGADVARRRRRAGGRGAECAMGRRAAWLDGGGPNAPRVARPGAGGAGTRAGGPGRGADGVDRFAETVAFNPSDLEETEERLVQPWRGLARKHSVAPDDPGRAGRGVRANLAAAKGRSGAGRGRKSAAVTAGRRPGGGTGQLMNGGGRTRPPRRRRPRRVRGSMRRWGRSLRRSRWSARSSPLPSADAAAGPEGAGAVPSTVATNPGATGRAAEQDRLRRGAVAVPAGLKSALTADDTGLTMTFDENRSRGSRRMRPPCGAPQAQGVGRGRAGSGRQPLAAGGDLARDHWRVAKDVEGRPDG